MTYTFMTNLLEAAGTRLESVRIESLKETTFYAVARLRSTDNVWEVDARPSDAIALALHLNSPIYVASELIEQYGLDIPAKVQNQLGKGLDSLKEKREEQEKEAEKQLSVPGRPEVIRQAYQELIAFLSGSK